MPDARNAIAHPRRKALPADGRANGIGDLAAALQDDDHDEEMHDQHDHAQQGRIAGPMQAEQQRHIGEGDAGDADGDDAPRPDLNVSRGLGANGKQAEGPPQSANETDQAARKCVGVHDSENNEADGCWLANLSPQQHRGDADKDQHREQFDREAAKREWQAEQQLPGPRQAGTAPMQLRLGGHGRWWIDDGKRLRGHTQDLRHARLQESDRTPDQAEDQPFGTEGAAEHQRQLPRDLDQKIIGSGIIRCPHDPVVERRKMRECPRHFGDLTRDFADLLRHRQEDCAPRPSADSGIGDFCSGAGGVACGSADDTLAIARSVSITWARF